MKAIEWSKPVDDQTAYRRAGGRLRYNRRRQGKALLRSSIVFFYFVELKMSPAEIAQREGVHITTIYRDIWKYRGKIRPYKAAVKASRKAAEEKARRKGWL